MTFFEKLSIIFESEDIQKQINDETKKWSVFIGKVLRKFEDNPRQYTGERYPFFKISRELLNPSVIQSSHPHVLEILVKFPVKIVRFDGRNDSREHGSTFGESQVNFGIKTINDLMSDIAGGKNNNYEELDNRFERLDDSIEHEFQHAFQKLSKTTGGSEYDPISSDVPEEKSRKLLHYLSTDGEMEGFAKQFAKRYVMYNEKDYDEKLAIDLALLYQKKHNYHNYAHYLISLKNPQPVTIKVAKEDNIDIGKIRYQFIEKVKKYIGFFLKTQVASRQ